MKTFQKKYFQKQLKRGIHSSLPQSERIPMFTDVKNIGILCCYENDEQMREILDTISSWQTSQHKMQLIVYIPFKNYPPILKNNLFVQAIFQSDFSFFGRPKSSLKQQLQAMHYELFINATNKPNGLVADYIAQCISADFKIGYDAENNHLYQLTLHMDEKYTFADFIHMIEKYTAKLNGQ